MTESSSEGSVPAVDEPRLAALAGQVRRAGTSLRLVSYSQAEEGCEALAAALLARLPRSELAGFAFAPIPRGGLIVLGMLAYILDLAPAQLLSLPASPRRLVLVDDCALTGGRFRQALAATASPEVFFAHLCSPPALRQAIAAAEPRVAAVLAAQDLADQAPASFPDPRDLAAFRRRWQQRMGGAGYWYGQPEPVAFAWSEPDRPFWNPATGGVEDGWRFFPPQRVLKNRARLGPPAAGNDRGPWRMADGVASGDFDGHLWLMRLEGGEVISLTGEAREMWRGLARWGGGEAAVAELVRQYAVEAETVRRDLEAFAEDLAARGFLSRRGGSHADGTR